jgi:hypothetical protein
MTIEDRNEASELRLSKHAQRLRTWEFICVTCGGHFHPAALEYSHIAPRKFHDDGGPQCRNCHAAFSDEERDLPYGPQSQNPQIESIGRYLLALSAWFSRIAETIAEFGRWLMQLADALPENAEGAVQ